MKTEKQILAKIEESKKKSKIGANINSCLIVAINESFIVALEWVLKDE